MTTTTTPPEVPPLVAVVDCGPGDRERLSALAAAAAVTMSDGTPEGEEIVARAQGAAVLVTMYTYTKVTAQVIDRLPDLRLVITRTAGHSHIDLEAATRRGIAVATVPDAPSAAVAEYTIGALLAVQRHLLQAAMSTREGQWRWNEFRGRELSTETLGVIGLGPIGTRVTQLARALGMTVLGTSRSRKDLPGVEQVPLEELLARSTAISINVPLTPQTRGLLGAEQLALLPEGAIVINTARGEVLDLEALCALLRSGHLAGACLDVLEGEPVPSEQLLPLRDVPNLLITPHISWHTGQTLERQLSGLTGKVLAFCEGRPIDTVPAPSPEELA